MILGSILIVLGRDNLESIFTTAQNRSRNLELAIKAPKATYMLGEVLVLDIKVENTGSSDIFLHGADVKSGYVSVFVASEDQKFLQYSHSAWGTTKKKGFTIKAGQTIESKASVLWNFSLVGRVADLNRVKESNILSDFAFSKPGVYFIKAVLTVPGEAHAKIESLPVQVLINEPVGSDLPVWESIKKNSEIAYFIQEGEIRSGKPENRKKILEEIDEIISNNPNSFLARQMNESLEKFRESEERRLEFKRKLQLKSGN